MAVRHPPVACMDIAVWGHFSNSNRKQIHEIYSCNIQLNPVDLLSLHQHFHPTGLTFQISDLLCELVTLPSTPIPIKCSHLIDRPCTVVWSSEREWAQYVCARVCVGGGGKRGVNSKTDGNRQSKICLYGSSGVKCGASRNRWISHAAEYMLCLGDLAQDAVH